MSTSKHPSHTNSSDILHDRSLVRPKSRIEVLEALDELTKGLRERIEWAIRTAPNPFEMHASAPLPDPYPQYPQLVTRVLFSDEIRKLDTGELGTFLLLYGDINGDFRGTLIPICYEYARSGEKLNLTWENRRARGTVVCNPNDDVTLITTLEDKLVDKFLERALQQRDFKAIRTILNFEGYGVPITEPNDLVIPEAWNAEDSDEEEVIEIEMTPEEYDMWQEMKDSPPEEITEPSSFLETPEFKAFVETMAQNIPLQLEHAIRQRDIPTLRMWLRLYGRHNIAAPDPDSALLGMGGTQKPPETPPTYNL